MTDISFIKKGLIEIIGDKELNQITKSSTDQSETGWLITAVFKERLQQQLGILETDGVLVRTGRAAFGYWLNGNSRALGWDSPDFRMLPTKTKINRGLNNLCDFFQSLTANSYSLSNLGSKWELELSIKNKNQCLENGMDGFLFWGFLQEFVSWAGQGRYYRITNDQSAGNGSSAWTYAIPKTPND